MLGFWTCSLAPSRGYSWLLYTYIYDKCAWIKLRSWCYGMSVTRTGLGKERKLKWVCMLMSSLNANVKRRCKLQTDWNDSSLQPDALQVTYSLICAHDWWPPSSRTRVHVLRYLFEYWLGLCKMSARIACVVCSTERPYHHSQEVREIIGSVSQV